MSSLVYLLIGVGLGAGWREIRNLYYVLKDLSQKVVELRKRDKVEEKSKIVDAGETPEDRVKRLNEELMHALNPGSNEDL